MLINEFSKPITVKSLNENLAKRYGKTIDVDKFTTEQLMNARNKLRTTLSQVETNESFDSVHTSDTYQKNKLFLELLNTALSERDMLEGEVPAGLKAYQDKKAGKEEKKEVKESIQISADTPQEASMMMQILKLAGVQQVDPAMINQEPEAGENPPHGEPGHSCGHDDDAMGSGEMGRMRDMMTAPAEEKAEETFANSMGDEKEEPKYQDTDTLVNFHSGGLNSQKQQVRKEYPGDNPLAVKEDTITELNLADSLRAQYEGFKEAYHKKAKMDEAPKPDFLDMDKDGDKKEPMKKAIKDKEAK